MLENILKTKTGLSIQGNPKVIQIKKGGHHCHSRIVQSKINKFNFDNKPIKISSELRS